MEITTYLERGLLSNLSGNVVDLCPVGALTSKPYAFMARPWELTKTPSIDAMDALGSAIRVDARGREVMRILPRVNDAINEEWISDKTRHVWDGLAHAAARPALRPAERQARAGKLGRGLPRHRREAEGPRRLALRARSPATSPPPRKCSRSSFSPRRSARPISIAARTAPSSIRRLGRATYLFNSTIAGIDQADAFLLVGTDPRLEAPVLNARILKRSRHAHGKLPIGLIGAEADLTYAYDYLGAGPETLAEIAERLPSFLARRSKPPSGRC